MYSSYDNPDVDLTLAMHEIWSNHALNVKKLIKIHQGNCIELYANNKNDADIVRDTLKGLESFIELYYNTADQGG